MSWCRLGTKCISSFFQTACNVFKILALVIVIIGGLSTLQEQSSTGRSRIIESKNISLTSIAPERVRIFCLVVTYKEAHDYAAVHVLRTWARHCTRVLFVSNEEHGELEPVVFKKEHPDRWALIKTSFDHIYRRYFDDADWFLKVHDDNFVVLENLRYLLYPYSPNQPIYFGCKLKNADNEPYMHAAAGYVLSREALRRFVQIAMPNDTLCRQAADGYEDEELGKCLTNVGVVAGDSRDKDGSSRFLAFTPREHLNGLDVVNHTWFYEKSYYEVENGTALMSPNAVSLSKMHSSQMYNFEYFIYRLRIYGMEKIAPTLASL